MQFYYFDGLTLATLSMDQGKYGDLGCISGWFLALRGFPRVTDGWLRVIGYRQGRWKWQGLFNCDFTTRWLPLATFGMDEGKRGNLGCISSCFWALRGAPRVTDGWLRVSGYRLGRWKWQRRFRCNLAMRLPHTKKKRILKNAIFIDFRRFLAV